MPDFIVRFNAKFAITAKDKEEVWKELRQFTWENPNLPMEKYGILNIAEVEIKEAE